MKQEQLIAHHPDFWQHKYMYSVITEKWHGLFCKETIYLEEKLGIFYGNDSSQIAFWGGFLWSNNSVDDQGSFSFPEGHCQGDEDCIKFFSTIIDLGLEMSLWNFWLLLKRKKKKTVSLGNSEQLVIKERWASGCYVQQLEDRLQRV